VQQLTDKYGVTMAQSCICSFLRMKTPELSFKEPLTSPRNLLRAYTLIERYTGEGL
jgi:hypothetical protein